MVIPSEKQYIPCFVADLSLCNPDSVPFVVLPLPELALQLSRICYTSQCFMLTTEYCYTQGRFYGSGDRVLEANNSCM